MSSRIFKTTGRTKWFSEQLGYGFVIPYNRPDGVQGDIMVHNTVIDTPRPNGFRSLSENDNVECEVEVQSDGRLKARRVSIL